MHIMHADEIREKFLNYFVDKNHQLVPDLLLTDSGMTQFKDALSLKKEDAIHCVWDFLTRELNIPAEKLRIAIHKSDGVAEKVWLDEGVSHDRILFMGDDTNFWSTGDTGPCGYSSEIFYDHGRGVPDDDLDDYKYYMEIWNFGFSQYNREKDGTYTFLSKPCISINMWLKRIAEVVSKL